MSSSGGCITPERTHVVNVLHAHIGVHDFAALAVKHGWTVAACENVHGVLGPKGAKLHSLRADGKFVGLNEGRHDSAIPGQGVRDNRSIAHADEE
jgi:hypothetical protein